MRMNNSENSIYRPGTADLIDTLTQASTEEVAKLLDNLKVTEAAQQRVYWDDEILHIEGPAAVARADTIFLSALEDGLKMGKLATQYLNIKPSQFSMIRNRNCSHKPSLDLIVIAALVNHRPFCVADVNHVLMELELPGLFTDTYDQNVNLRNYILARILTYAQEHECPRERWIHFAREALDFLGMKPLHKLSCDTIDLSLEEEALLTQWQAEAMEECVQTDYTRERNRFLERYAQESGLTVSKALARLAATSFTDPGTIRDVFASKFPSAGTRGSRETLIQGSIYMGCTLEETNAMLRHANHALLYPFRENDSEVRSITKLLGNGVSRAGKKT